MDRPCGAIVLSVSPVPWQNAENNNRSSGRIETEPNSQVTNSQTLLVFRLTQFAEIPFLRKLSQCVKCSTNTSLVLKLESLDFSLHEAKQ